MRYKNWTITFEPLDPFNSLLVVGNGVQCGNLEDVIEVKLDIGYKSHVFLSVSRKGDIILNTPALFLYPVFSAKLNGKIVLSNRASSLMAQGDEIRIKPFTFIRHLTGVPYPEENIFDNIQLLHASSAYELNGENLLYRNSLLSGGQSLKAEEAIEYLLEDTKSMFSDGKPISLLLSGGYDSRLNLALARHHQKSYKNEIKLYHEYKDQDEFDIAQAVASASNMYMTVKNRTDFLPVNRSVFVEEPLIDLQSGFYRENLIRWHRYFDWIQEDNPGGLIFGFGVEAHKGKYYQKVSDFELDTHSVFGANEEVVGRVAKQVGIRVSNKEQELFFEDLISRSYEFESLDSRIDHVHYHTYCANGYGKRCHDLLQQYNFSFPFLDHTFLKMVFSLPRKEKEAFEVVNRAMSILAPDLNNHKFTSANAKATKPKQNHIITKGRRSLGKLKRTLVKNRVKRKGRLELSDLERKLINSINPQSEVTDHLHSLLKNNWIRADFIQLDYLVQGFLYLTLCEKKHGVSFKYATKN